MEFALPSAGAINVAMLQEQIALGQRVDRGRLSPCPSAAQSKQPPERSYPDPRRFEQAVVAFETLADSVPTPEHAIVCLGSSSMRLWHRTIGADLSPLTVIPRGFGGSTMMDALYCAERLVIASRTRAVLLYVTSPARARSVRPVTPTEGDR